MKERRLGFMDQATAEEACEAMAKSTAAATIEITYHGGEPLLQSGEWFEQTTQELQKRVSALGKQVRFSLQSNGSLLDERHVETFLRHRILVGISLDGERDVQNSIRGEFDRTLASTLRLHHTVLLGGIIAVLTTRNYRSVPGLISLLEEAGIERLSLNEYWATGRGTQALSLSSDELLESWETILDYMLATRGKKVCDRLTLDRVHRLLHPPSRDAFRKILVCTHPFCHAGIHMLHVATDGTLYPCGSAAWSTPQPFVLGSISHPVDDETWISVLARLHRKPNTYYRVCSMCSAAAICSFGCAAFAPSDPGGMKALCGATRKFHDRLRQMRHSALEELDRNGRRMAVPDIRVQGHAR